MDGNDIAIGNISDAKIRPDAAAVDKSDVRPGNHSVSVSTEVAQIRLTVSDQTDTGFRRGGQRHIGVGHHLFQFSLVIAFESLSQRNRFPYPYPGNTDEPGDKVPVSGDYQLADIGKPCSGRRQQYLFSIFIVYHIAGDHAVGMAIQNCVDSGRAGDQIRGTEGGRRFIIPQMRQDDHIIRAFLPAFVHCLLYLRVQFFSAAAVKVIVKRA